MSNLAIVVVPHVSSPPPPPPAAPTTQQQDCKYSAKVGGDNYNPVYQCFSQEEWDARNAQIAQQQAAQNAQTRAEMHQFFTHSIWIGLGWLIVGAIALVILVSICDAIGNKIHKKRHPDHYSNGQHKSGFGYYGDKYAPKDEWRYLS